MNWDQAKDAILGILVSGLVGYLSFEAHSLRITIEKLLVKVDVLDDVQRSHGDRLSDLEDGA